MAVSIMSACCRVSVLPLYLFVYFHQVLGQGEVFREAPLAHSVFQRPRRANTFFLEEILQGSLERECYEELCNYEEAREYFEDDASTIAFWTIYYDGNQCDPNPCLHGGNCTDKVGGFHCSCPAHHFGPICKLDEMRSPPSAPQITAETTPTGVECPTSGPNACHQLCSSSSSFTCSCMTGFKLQEDQRSCAPAAEFPCGRLPDWSNVTSMCRHGNCPWQVLVVLNRQGTGLCGGVVLGRRSVLTLARCVLLEAERVPPSHLRVVAGNNKISLVTALYVHDRFRSDRHDNDLALLELTEPLSFGPALIPLCLPTKDFCENVLMHSGRTGVTTRQRGRKSPDLVYITLDECRGELNVSHPLSNKMFCMRRRDRHLSHAPRNPTAAGNQTLSVSHAGRRSEISGSVPGTPVATVEKGTAFLTGLLVATPLSRGHVFTKLSRYLSWIRPRLEAAEARMTPQVLQFPEVP